MFSGDDIQIRRGAERLTLASKIKMQITTVDKKGERKTMMVSIDHLFIDLNARMNDLEAKITTILKELGEMKKQ